MEVACPGCGYISDRPSRFCRQCGKQLYLETEASAAATRNYESNRAPEPNPLNPPHYETMAALTAQGINNPVINNEAQETVRFYHPPQAAYQEFTERKGSSRVGFWIMIAFLCVFIVGGGIAALVVLYSYIPAVPAPAEDNIAKKMPPPPVPPPPGASKTASPEVAGKYKYPNAQIEHSVSTMGNEVVKMSTGDSLETVRAFYSRLTGLSQIVRSRDKGKEEVVFQAPGSPPVLIVIGPDDDLPGNTQIVFIRSGFQIPI
ncbi:MAG: zinc ribbon domain-containing protein [Blastocatellia bacterium]|nr:zinc ribbon domain-containing protein [Blastocatellia bacterium]